MTLDASLVDSQRLVSLADSFKDKLYRDTYVATHTRRVLARQMRKFRGERSQAAFARELGTTQTIISRLENPNYSGWSLRTMLDTARKLNVAVFVRFVDFPTFLKYTDDMSEAAMRPARYDEETRNEFARQVASPAKKGAEGDTRHVSGEKPGDLSPVPDPLGFRSTKPPKIGGTPDPSLPKPFMGPANDDRKRKVMGGYT